MTDTVAGRGAQLDAAYDRYMKDAALLARRYRRQVDDAWELYQTELKVITDAYQADVARIRAACHG
jgi:hypothetical protein